MRYETNSSGYLNRALYNWEETVELVCKKLKKHRPMFDVVACTGTSGLLIGPAVAARLGKKLLVVRKPDDSSHSCTLLEGWLPVQERMHCEFIGPLTQEQTWDLEDYGWTRGGLCQSYHGGHVVAEAGTMRYVLVDDFVSSGQTIRRVNAAILAKAKASMELVVTYSTDELSTKVCLLPAVSVERAQKQYPNFIVKVV